MSCIPFNSMGGGMPCRSPHDGAGGDVRHSLRILVVEDEPVNQFFMGRLLEKMGHRPRLASQVDEAFACMEEEHFDLILMDIQLPDMNGMDATRRIRSNPPAKQAKDIPIVAVTAFAMEANREQALAAGMDDHIAKPVELDALQRVIGRFF